MPSTCRSCGTPIIWAVTKAGKRMPLDENLTAEGEWTVDASGNLVRRAPALRLGHVSHFATCSRAAQHRQAR